MCPCCCALLLHSFTHICSVCYNAMKAWLIAVLTAASIGNQPNVFSYISLTSRGAIFRVRIDGRITVISRLHFVSLKKVVEKRKRLRSRRSFQNIRSCLYDINTRDTTSKSLCRHRELVYGAGNCVPLLVLPINKHLPYKHVNITGDCNYLQAHTITRDNMWRALPCFYYALV